MATVISWVKALGSVILAALVGMTAGTVIVLLIELYNKEEQFAGSREGAQITLFVMAVAVIWQIRRLRQRQHA